MLVYSFFFFFSSRRRHTRSLRDWSSDVCSSDLEIQFQQITKILNRKVIDRFTRWMPAGVVNQTIELAKAGHGRLDEIPDLFAFGNIASDEVRFARTLLIKRASKRNARFFGSCAINYS